MAAKETSWQENGKRADSFSLPLYSYFAYGFSLLFKFCFSVYAHFSTVAFPCCTIPSKTTKTTRILDIFKMSSYGWMPRKKSTHFWNQIEIHPQISYTGHEQTNTLFPYSLGWSRNNGFKSRVNLVLLFIKANLDLFRDHLNEFGKGLLWSEKFCRKKPQAIKPVYLHCIKVKKKRSMDRSQTH